MLSANSPWPTGTSSGRSKPLSHHGVTGITVTPSLKPTEKKQEMSDVTIELTSKLSGTVLYDGPLQGGSALQEVMEAFPPDAVNVRMDGKPATPEALVMAMAKLQVLKIFSQTLDEVASELLRNEAFTLSGPVTVTDGAGNRITTDIPPYFGKVSTEVN